MAQREDARKTDDVEPADDDTEGHGIRLTNVNETIVQDEPADDEPADDDTEGHGILSNVNETIVEDEPAPDEAGPIH